MQTTTLQRFHAHAFCCLIFTFLTARTIAQCTGTNCGPNLIPNPSFELTTSDCSTNSVLHTNRSPVQDWYGLSSSTGLSSGTTPDYYNVDCAKKATENCGDGKGSVGIFTYDQRESVQARLLSPLVEGHMYCFTMKVKSWPAGACDNDGIGAWFHKKGKIDIDAMNNSKQFLGTGSKLNASPQVKNPAGNMITGTCQTITGTFCATGGESWIVISNFKSNQATQHAALGYVIIDEVSLNEINCIAINGISSPADSVCPGSCTTLTANATGGNGTYTYLWSPNGETTKSIQACAGLVPTLYKCTVSSSAGCSKTISVTDSFTLYPRPFLPAPTITPSGPTTICRGDSVTLTSSIAPGYLWNPDQQTTPSITVGKAGVYTVTIQHPVSACNSTSTGIAVKVNELPKIDTKNMVTDSTDCGQKTGSITGISVSGVPVFEYSWDGGPKTTTHADLKGAAAGTHTLTVTDGNGCIQTATGTVWNKQAPDSATVNSTSAIICEGLKTILFVSPSNPAIVYTWSTPGQTTVINDSIVLDPVKLSDAGTYTVTATKNNCASPEAHSKLTVNAAAIHEKAVVSNNRICEGDTVTIDAAHHVPGISYAIYTQASGGAPIGTAPLKISPKQTTIYYMEAVSSKGCSQLTERDTVTVFVYRAPDVPPPIASNLVICEGQTTTIDVQNPVAGNTYNVYDASTGGKLLGKTPLTVTLTKTTTLYIEAVTPQGCKQITGRSPIAIKVNPTPAGPKIHVENITGNYICDGLSAKLISSIASGIIWSTGATTPSILVTQAGTYWVFYTDANGCASPKDSVAITIKQPPQVDAAGFVIDTVQCYSNIGGIHGVNIQGGTAPYSYKWFETGNPNAILSTDLVLKGVSSGKYTLVVTDKNGCEDRLNNVFIPSKGGVIAHLSGTPLSGFEPLTVDLFTATAGVGKPVSYLWKLDGYVLSTTDSSKYIVKDLHFGEHVISVTVRDTNGCEHVDYLKLFVDVAVILHDVNIFTPNNDGHNDVLVFPSQGVRSMHVKIYDRWGLKLFEWKDPETGWNGTTTSGEAVPEGTYYYLIDFEDYYGNTHQKSGFVHLMRN